MKRFVLVLALIYLLFLIVGCILIESDLNSYWLVALFLFSPRWVVALPLVVLLPITLWFRWKLSFLYVIHLVVILGPILGYQVRGTTVKTADSDRSLRVLTCNVGGGDLDEKRMIEFVNDHQIDVVMLQECQASVSKSLFKELDWQYRQKHQVVIGSSMNLSESRVLANQPRSNYRVAAAVTCLLERPGGGVRVQLVSVHLPTFRPALEKLLKLELDEGPVAMDEMSQKHRHVAAQLHQSVRDQDIPIVIAGDFNVPIESDCYRDYWQDYSNAFSAVGRGFGYTKFTRYHGIRIDHILVDDHWTVIRCYVGPDMGGDHRPVIAELVKSSAT